MKKHPLILRCLIVLLALTLLPMFPVSEGNVLSFLPLGGTPAIAESLSVSVTLSGMNCYFTVNNAVSPTTWCQLLDSEGNILSSWDYSSTEGGMNFPINTPGEYRYYVIVIDSATGERASAYTPYFTFAKCSHPTTIKTNEKKVYWEKNDSSHSIVLIYTPECTVCYKTLDPEEEIIGSGSHRFNNNGVCRDCDYCSHEEVRKEYTGESTVVNKNDYYYHYIETPYKVYCSYCNEHLKDGVESIEEVHQFSGYCFCGYYSCPHENRTYRYIGVEYGIDGLSNEKQHHVGKFYELYCYDCEEVVVNGYMNSENPNLYKTYWEDHTFDSNGECIYCHDINPDYSPETPVPPADLQVAVGMNTTAAFKGDKLTATASVSGGSGKYACDWVITCNGAVVEMTAFDPGLTYVYYANQTGNWKFTAYVTDKENSNLKTVSASGPVVTVTECTHENTTTESIGNPSYEQLNDQQHTVIETVKDVCSNCGAVVKDEYTVTQPENHAFNKENKCTLCGYIVPDETCKHTKTKEVTQTTYNENGICDNDPDRHYRTVYKKRVCSDCKEVIENSETTNSKYENHNFDATGKCVCGYTKKSEDTYKKLAVSIRQWNSNKPYQPSVGINTSSMGATAYISGGSGNYTCEWSAVNDNGKRSQKTITTTESVVSWGVNVYSPDTWKFTITVTDNETGKHVSASSSTTVYKRDTEDDLPITERYAIYVDTPYFSEEGDIFEVTLGTQVKVHVYDKQTKTYTFPEGCKLTLDDSSIAELRGDTLIVHNKGIVDQLYIRLKQGNTELCSALVIVSFLSVETKNKFFVQEYNMKFTSGVNLSDMEEIDWDKNDLLVTPTTAIADFKAKKQKDGSYKVTFDAYNSALTVYGIAVYDAQGNQIDIQMVSPYSYDDLLLTSMVNTFANTERIFNKKAHDGNYTEKTSMELFVPDGGFIKVLQMNEDDAVMVANVAELLLGCLAIYDDVEGLVNNTSVREVKTFRDSLKGRAKIEFYQAADLYLKDTFGENVGEVLPKVIEDGFKEGTLEGFMDYIADGQGSESILDVMSIIIKECGTTSLRSAWGKVEDSFLVSQNPLWYYAKQGAFTFNDTSAMGKLMEDFVKCYKNGEDMTYVDTIRMPYTTPFEEVIDN